MSCSSLMDVSNLMMSACLASMSANVCFAAAVSIMIPCKQVMPVKKKNEREEWMESFLGCLVVLKGKSICANVKLILLVFSCNQINLPTTHYTNKIFQDYFYKMIIFFTCVKTAGLPCSNISSNSSLVVVRPAEQKDLVLTVMIFLKMVNMIFSSKFAQQHRVIYFEFSIFGFWHQLQCCLINEKLMPVKKRKNPPQPEN